MKVSALIPVKGFSGAKQRLSPLLSAPEREVLAEAMLRDVLGQVLLTKGLEATFVVTGDARVSGIAFSLGAHVILEQEEQGETEAVALALTEMKQKGVQRVLIIPADIPLLHSSDIGLLLEHVVGQNPVGPFALLVPSHDRMGTNALVLSPPGVIALRFGYDSFSYHLRQVAARGLPVWVWENERIALDIDEPKDLERFLQVVARVRGSTSSPPRAKSKGGSCSPNEPSSRAQAEGHDNRARARENAGETYERVLRMSVIGAFESAHRSGKI